MKLIEEDLHHVLSRLPRDVAKLLRATPGLLLGGGFVRSIITGEKVSDIDLFGPSKEMLKSVAQSFALERKARFHETDNAFTVLTPGRPPVQFIHRWTYTAPSDVIKDFDFSIAQAVIWWVPQKIEFDNVGALDNGQYWESLISDHYYPDLASKRLRYLSPSRVEDAGGSLLRVRKFLARGYHIEAPSLAKVIARLSMGVKEMDNHDEEWRARIMTALLREVDPLTVVDGLELVDEHQATSQIGSEQAPPVLPEYQA